MSAMQGLDYFFRDAARKFPWPSRSQHDSRGFGEKYVGPAMLLAALLVLGGSALANQEWGSNLPAGLVLIAAGIVVGIFAMAVAGGEPMPRPRPRWAAGAAAALIIVHLGIAYGHLKATPGGDIDCFTFQEEASRSLWHGVDPYGLTHANLYNPRDTRAFYGPGVVVNGRVQVGLQYPPVTFLTALPGYLVGDVRYGYVAAIVLTALLVFAMLPDARGVWFMGFLLLDPITFVVEDRCWTEPLVLMLVCATLYAARRRSWWLPLAFGLFLASKQYNFLALPFLGYLVRPFQWRTYWKLMGSSIAIGLLSALPFALWNMRALWHDLVLFHLAQPFRQDAVSFAVELPVYAKVGPVLLVVFLVWAARRKGYRLAMFPLAYGMAMLLFVSASKQAFANYYFLITETLLLGSALLWSRRLQEAEGHVAC
jgi:hypothetical protein